MRIWHSILLQIILLDEILLQKFHCLLGFFVGIFWGLQNLSDIFLMANNYGIWDQLISACPPLTWFRIIFSSICFFHSVIFWLRFRQTFDHFIHCLLILILGLLLLPKGCSLPCLIVSDWPLISSRRFHRTLLWPILSLIRIKDTCAFALLQWYWLFLFLVNGSESNCLDRSIVKLFLDIS